MHAVARPSYTTYVLNLSMANEMGKACGKCFQNKYTSIIIQELRLEVYFRFTPSLNSISIIFHPIIFFSHSLCSPSIYRSCDARFLLAHIRRLCIFDGFPNGFDCASTVHVQHFQLAKRGRHLFAVIQTYNSYKRI